MTTKPNLKIFVYGTLKQGYHNHVRFCQGVLSVEKAHVDGRLYKLGAGLPALEVPSGSILAVGSHDHLKDLTVQEDFRLKPKAGIELNETRAERGLVYGEILNFPYPSVQQFSNIDRLECFNANNDSGYKRVLVHAHCEACTEPVWLYTLENLEGRGQRIMDGLWV